MAPAAYAQQAAMSAIVMTRLIVLMISPDYHAGA
jgi:hypothetical protein